MMCFSFVAINGQLLDSAQDVIIAGVVSLGISIFVWKA